MPAAAASGSQAAPSWLNPCSAPACTITSASPWSAKCDRTASIASGGVIGSASP